MSEEEQVLRAILRRLDTILAIQRLSNKDVIDRLRHEVEKDKVAWSILEKTRTPISYNELAETVSRETGAGDRTAKRRIADLTRDGFIITSRAGKQVYYENAGILE